MEDYHVNGNIPDEEPKADTGVFIPSLSKALAPFITEEARSEGYEWEWQNEDWTCVNACSYHLQSILELFEVIVHMSIGIFASGLSDFTVEDARNHLELVCASTDTPQVVADAMQEVSVEEVWNIVRQNAPIIGNPTLTLQTRSWIKRSRLWLYHCATHKRAGLTNEQTWLLERSLWPKSKMYELESNLREQLRHVEQVSKHFFPEFEESFDDLGHVSEEDRPSVIKEVISHFVRIAMAVADIWETSSLVWPNRDMPPYGCYVRGYKAMRDLINKEVCDRFSPKSVHVRYALSGGSIKGVWDFLWYEAREAQHFNEFKESTLSMHLFNWLLLGFAIACDDKSSQRHVRPLRFVSPILPYESYRVDFEHPGFSFAFQDVSEVILYGDEFGQSVEYFGEMEIPEDLEDAELVAVGPPIDVQPFVEPVTTNIAEGDVCALCCEELLDGESKCVQLKVCGRHCFHRSCIEDLINSSSKVSNLCPMDRKEICPKRPVMPKDQVEATIDDGAHSGEEDDWDSVYDEDADDEFADSP
ncbi:hypothetical protein BDV96DRAFT_596032 [Lophiotrema nucula]|uniref:RING-type domain-containing protein n=1 Tax=Lophiotrema nucula TaxID=690887 RepID=A0A6A5ZLF6_9PLEO|nr:hypothetical protein BDV96DRAFT_596032 [Lophiotrema nucula]